MSIPNDLSGKQVGDSVDVPYVGTAKITELNEDDVKRFFIRRVKYNLYDGASVRVGSGNKTVLIAETNSGEFVEVQVLGGHESRQTTHWKQESYI